MECNQELFIKHEMQDAFKRKNPEESWQEFIDVYREYLGNLTALAVVCPSLTIGPELLGFKDDFDEFVRSHTQRSIQVFILFAQRIQRNMIGNVTVFALKNQLIGRISSRLGVYLFQYDNMSVNDMFKQIFLAEFGNLLAQHNIENSPDNRRRIIQEFCKGTTGEFLLRYNINEDFLSSSNPSEEGSALISKLCAPENMRLG